jgi:separase
MVAASIHRARNDFASSVANLSQAHRLWTRAIGNLARLTPSEADETPSIQQVSNPFEVAKPPDQATSADDLARPKPRATTGSRAKRFDGVMWRTTRGLLDCLFALAETSARRGTARDTEFFLQEALELARSANSTEAAARALAGRGLLSFLLGSEEECNSFITQGLSIGDMVSPARPTVCHSYRLSADPVDVSLIARRS